MFNEIDHALSDKNYPMFQVQLYRLQTRYQQQNYIRTAYKVEVPEDLIELSLSKMLAICDNLEDIGYQTTSRKYNSKSQRKLMTRELRERIMERDNYTCQMCGKYMPDEVGLHVDHIIPVAKGGKSIESNLQVLCDKCNLRKGNK